MVPLPFHTSPVSPFIEQAFGNDDPLDIEAPHDRRRTDGRSVEIPDKGRVCVKAGSPSSRDGERCLGEGQNTAGP